MFKKNILIFLLVTFAVFGVLIFPASADQQFPYSDDGFRYTGRIAFENESAFLTWPGSSIHFAFTGNRLKLDLEDTSGQNYMNVIFNGKDDFPYVLHLQKGRHVYDLSHFIDREKSQVTIFKRTEGEEGGTYFHGVEIGDSQQLLSPPKAPKRRILFYGDSITVGMGNEAAYNDPDSKPAEKNHYLSYASIAARILNAEHHAIAKSGIGFMVSWFDFIMPEYYDQLTGENNNSSRWDFAAWQPDVVVVNLGQNDRWLIENEKRLQAQPKDIQQAYEAFLRKLMSHHPDAVFICAIGSMDAASTSKWPNYIANAIASIKASPKQKKDIERLHTFVFEFTGYRAHPRVKQHYDNARALSNFIADKMHWAFRG